MERGEMMSYSSSNDSLPCGCSIAIVAVIIIAIWVCQMSTGDGEVVTVKRVISSSQGYGDFMETWTLDIEGRGVMNVKCGLASIHEGSKYRLHPRMFGGYNLEEDYGDWRPPKDLTPERPISPQTEPWKRDIPSEGAGPHGRP